MPTTEARLTPKQQQVFNHLKAGLQPADIAKKMRTSRSSVYGHIRKMREAGIILPNEQILSSDDAHGTTSGTTKSESVLPDEPSEPIRALDLAISNCDRQLKELAAEQDEIQVRLEAIGKAREMTGNRRQRYAEARGVLNGTD